MPTALVSVFISPKPQPMKSTVKKASFGLFVSLLLLVMMVFSSCQEEALAPRNDTFTANEIDALLLNDETGIADYETDKAGPPFDFGIQVTRCRKPTETVALDVMIDEPANYYYRWRVDGRDAGYGIGLPCLCAKSASVFVTRKSDLLSVRKTILLSGCHSSGIVNPEYPVR